jgi:hypothetical protein
MDTNTDGATSAFEVIREDDSIGRLIKTNGHHKTLCETRQQPALLRAVESFSTTIEKWNKYSSTKLEKWDKGFSTAAYRAAREASETLRVHDELVEYHGGADHGADIYILALGYLEQEPDADLKKRLWRLIWQYGEELELRRLWKLLDRHRSRVRRSGPAERVERIHSGFKQSYGSYQVALNTLANYYRDSKTEVLEGAIRDQVCSVGAWLLLDKEIIREVGNRIRREATRRRKEIKDEREPKSNSKPGVSRPVDPINLEQVSFDALDQLERLAKKAAESRATKPTAQELESFTLSAYMTYAEAAAESRRSKDQVKMESRRSRDKFRKAADI